MDRSVRVKLALDVSDYLARIQQAAAATTNFAQKTEQAATKQKTDWSAASTGLMAFGAAAAGGLVMAVKGYADFDAQMSKVAASTGASSAELGQLKEAAMAAGQEFGQFTSTDAASALEELGKAGLSTQESIDALRGTMGLAAADGMQVGRAAEITAQGLTIFSREGVTATQVADRLAQAAGAAVGSAEEIGQGLGNVGPLAASMGISLNDTTQALALFAQNGVRGAEGGTLLKSMLMKLQNPTDQAAQAMQDLGLNAYDAQGAFVGLPSIFAQLAEKTKGMTAEQRDATMATIFGTHAVLGASIAAKEGASGWDAMGQAMAGFGSAADMAAKKNDNLKGDFAQLGGAWENLGIKIGEAANGPMRAGVQSLTGLLEWAGKNTSLSQGLVLTAAGIGGIALAAGGLMKAIGAVTAFKSAVTALGVAGKLTEAGGKFRQFFSDVMTGSNGARGALIKFAAGAAATTAAAAAVRAYGEASVAAYGAARAKSDDLASSISRGQTDIAGRFSITEGAIIKSTMSMGQSIKRAFEPTPIQAFGDAMNSMFAGSNLPNEIKKNFDELDKALTSVKPDQAAATFRQVAEQAAAAGTPVAHLVELLPQYKARLEEQAKALGVTGLSSQDYVDWMGGKVPDAIRRASAAAAAGRGPQEQLAGTFADQEMSAKDAADALTQLANAQLGLSGSKIAVTRAKAGLKDSVKENGTSLNVNSLKGANNVEALNALASAHMSLVKSSAEAGASTEQLARQTASAKAEFIQAATAAGFNKGQVAAMADQYYQVPAVVETRLQIEDALAQTSISGFLAKLQGLPPETVAELTAIARDQGLDAAKKKLEETRDKVVTLTAKGRDAGAKAAAAGVAGAKDNHVDLVAKAIDVGAKALRNVIDNSKDKRVTLAAKGVDAGARALKGVVDGARSKGVSFIARAVDAGVRGLRSVVDNARGKGVTLTAAGRDQGARAARSTVENARSNTITLTTIVRTIRQFVGAITGKADGGPIIGQGGPREDNLLIAASNGEYMIRAAAAARLGRERLDYMNRYGQIPAFRDGGPIGRTLAATAGASRLNLSMGDTRVTVLVDGQQLRSLVRTEIDDVLGNQQAHDRQIARMYR